MTNPQNDKLTLQKPLRVWPGLVIAILVLLLRFVVPAIIPEALFYGVLGQVIGAFAIPIWWLFFSRAPWVERLGVVVLMILAVFTTRYIVHESIAKGGMGMFFYFLAIPAMSFALVLSAVITRRLSNRVRRVTVVAMILLACGVWTLIRTGGFTGEFDHDFAWRWSQTPEQRLLSQAPNDWPGFRGSKRDGIIHGLRIKTDWAASPPVELWRRKIGLGWSSFAVNGNLLYTQEQRGDYEVVACYNKTTGRPVWTHRYAALFWESNAVPGPGGTPTIHNDRVYALGATGILNALDDKNGTVVWSRNAASDTKTKVPGSGFSSSPLVIDDVVIVATAGQLVAYDIITGQPRWFGPKHETDYSSPHLLVIDNVPQVLLLSGSGATSVAPANGKVFWEYPLPTSNRIVQPAVMADGDILINEGQNLGLRRIAVKRTMDGWRVKELWKSNGLKPHFSDFVIHDGHAFGFDGRYLSCIDLQDGERKWKGGRYGSGQLLLLADQDVMLVLSEKGELALVKATTYHFNELARVPAIQSQTWNHPALVGDVLLVRNGKEMAAFRLSREGD